MEEFIVQLITTYPVITTGCSGLGILFLALEFIIPLTPTNVDDEVWGRVNSGYTGKLIKAIKFVAGRK